MQYSATIKYNMTVPRWPMSRKIIKSGEKVYPDRFLTTRKIPDMTTAIRIRPRTAPDKLTRFCRIGPFNTWSAMMYASSHVLVPDIVSKGHITDLAEALVKGAYSP